MKGRKVPTNVRSKVINQGEGQRVKALELWSFECVAEVTPKENSLKEEWKTQRDMRN